MTCLCPMGDSSLTGVGRAKTVRVMRLVMDIDLDRLPNDRSKEAGRILRFWAGALAHMELTQAAEHTLLDSEYQPVGSLRLLETEAEGARSLPS